MSNKEIIYLCNTPIKLACQELFIYFMNPAIISNYLEKTILVALWKRIFSTDTIAMEKAPVFYSKERRRHYCKK